MIRTVEGRWGKVSYFGKDEYVGKSIHNYGEYNPDETEMILSLADKTKLVIDIGANIGCIAQALGYEGFETIAFEPQPAVFKVMKENFKGVSHNCALGSVAGVAKMPKVHYSERGNFGGLGIGAGSIYGTYDVPVQTLDSFFITNVGLIKIDVEGYEEEVLKGAVYTIAKSRPILYIEDDRQEKSLSLRKYLLNELKYSIEEHRPPLYREKNFFDKRKNVWDKNYASHNIICRPL